MKLTVFRSGLLAMILICAHSLFGQVANFTTNNTAGCSPLVVSFQNLSSGATTYRWDFGNGNGSLQANPAAIYLNPGVYTVKLIAYNGASTDTIVKTQLITVFQDPSPGFSSNVQGGCVPATIQFTNGSTPGDTTINYWLWDFGDGTTSTQQNPSHVYTSPGTFDVTLLIRDANGCSNEITIDDYVTITPAPTANFTGAPTWSCAAPLTTNFSNTSTGTGLTYAWDFGDNTTSTLQTPSHTYTAPGQYRVRLTVTDVNGCTAVRNRNNYIRIYDMQTGFTVSDTSVCEGETVVFTDTSGPNAATWLWAFGDGNTSTQQHPSHAYSTAGVYTVTLISTDIQGCADTMVRTDLITVEEAPTADFTADTTASCSAPLEVNFTDLSTNAVSWAWDFGDGGSSTDQNPTYIYNFEGNYNVSLTVTNAAGCSHTHTTPNFITISGPQVNITTDTTRGCIDLTVNFTDMSTSSVDPITGWAWDFGDGGTSTDQNPQHVYTQDGVYDVTLVVTTLNGCTDSMTFANYIEAGMQPNAAFTGNPLETCLFFPVDFVDTSDIGDFWFWDFGDGGTSLDQNPGYQYGDTGTFTVTLIVGNHGCFDTIIKPDYIRIYPPDARYLVTYNCTDPYTVDFTDISLGGHVWLWDFGTGDTSSLQSPTYTFPARGDYDVTLTVWDTIGGCFDSLMQVVTITDPISGFTGTNLAGCVPHQASFTSAATDAFSYQWFFGDGTSTTNPNPTHTYNTSGIFDVTLVVTDIHGCTDTFTRDDYVTVYEAVAGFVADTLTGCTPLAVSYTDTSSAVMGTITSWWWDLGNGDTSTLQNPSTVYTIPGNYTIRLVIGDSNGCTDTLTRVNYIVPTYPTPSFQAMDTLVCVGESVFFANNSSGVGMTYIWDFGDGDSSFASAPTHTYADTGLYTVSLYVQDVNGCDSFMVRTNYIRVVQPTADFIVDTLNANCPPLLVNFTDLSPDSVTQWAWNFGDGGTSNLQHPSHIYNRPGVYHPSLIITNANGCTDTLMYPDSIVILGPWGSFNFVQTTVCVPFEVDFYASGTDSTVLHIWDFGDGDVSVDDDTTTHAYTSPGTYNPVMILDDQMGCIVSIPSPGPIVATEVFADFNGTPEVQCKAGNVYFIDQSTGTPGVVAWAWNFGDGGTSTVQNPVHYYAAPGVYTVTLVATNAAGCMDTMVKPDFVTVHPGPDADFTVNTQASCFPTTINYTDQSTSDTTITARKWYFGDGDSSAVTNPSHTYAAAGTYTTTLIVTNARGCTDTTTLPITIYPLPPASAGADTTICIGQSVTMNGSGGVTYSWTPGTGLASVTNPNTLATPAVTTTYVLLVTDANGCSRRDTMTIYVNPLPTPTASPNQAICIGGSANLTSGGGVAYQWTPTTTLSNANIANPVATPTATTTYTVVVTDNNGCSANTTTQVTVNPLPVTSTSPDQEICIGDTATITATGGVSYQWSPAASLSTPAQAQSQAFPTSNTSYVVTVTDGNGCVNTDTTAVAVNLPPTITVTPNSAICLGNSIQLNAAGGVAYAWSPAASLSCAACANPVASPNATTTYVVVVTSDKGCIDSAQVTVTVNPLPVPVISPDQAICIGGSANLSISGGITYAWTPAATLSDSTLANPIATPAITTSYSVLVTDNNGCQASASIQVTVNPLPVTATSPDQEICIGDTTTIEATGGISYQWSPAASLDAPAQAQSYAYPTASTAYVVTVTDVNGCVNTDTTFVVVNPLPVITVSPDAAICSGDSIPLSASGGVSYFWSPSTVSCDTCANTIALPDTTTTYVVIVTSDKGCVDSASVTITVHPLPQVTTSPDALICPGESTQLTANGGATYQWSPAASLSCANCQSPIASPDSNTVYTVQVTSAFGCVSYDSTYVFVNQVDAQIGASDSAACIPALITFTDLSGADSAIVAWSWTFGDGGTSTVQHPSYTYNTPGNYTVKLKVTTSTGCTDSTTLPVTIWGLPVANAGPDQEICVNDTAQLNGSGGITYAWSHGASLSDASASNPMAFPVTYTHYRLTVTDINGCQDSDTTFVAVRPLPNPTITASNPVVCAGNAIQLQATGGVDYQWSPAQYLDSTHISNPVSTPYGNITYTVHVTDSNGCENTQTIAITARALPNLFVGPDTTICVGNSVTLDATGGIFYNWTPAGSLSCDTCANPLATPDSTTTYLVDASNYAGCHKYDSITVNVEQLPAINITADTMICAGESVNLSASGGGDYRWATADTLSCYTCANPVAQPVNTSDYGVTVTTPFGCVDSSRVTVAVNQIHADFDLSDSVSCLPADIRFTDFSTSDTTISNYLWTFGDGDSATVQNTSHLYTAEGQVDATLWITNAFGCKDSVSKPITLLETPVAVAGADTTICAGTSTQLHGSGGGSYLWDNPMLLNDPAIADPIAYPAAATTFVLTVTLPNGCSDQDSITVGRHSLPAIQVSPNVTSCYADTVQLNASGGSIYTWSPATGLSDANVANPVAYADQTTTYTVSVTDANQCTATDSVTIYVNPLPTLVLDGPNDLCKGDTATLTASGGNFYAWTPTNSVSCPVCPTQTVSPANTTTYHVLATNQYNCSIRDSITVHVRPLPTVNVMPNTTICEGDAINITSTATNAGSYAWSPAASLNGASLAQPTASPTTTTNYQVTVTSAYGCSATDEVTINVIDKVYALISTDTTICEGSYIQLRATVRDAGIFGSDIVWSPASAFTDPSDANQMVKPKETTTYTVVVSGGACQADTQQITVVVQPNPKPDLGKDRTVIGGDEVELNAGISDNIVEYAWSPTTGLNCTDCEEVNFIAENDVTYSVEVTDGYGCKGTDTVRLKVIETCEDDLFVPNSFSPNGDKMNDVVYVRGHNLAGLKVFRIFDRWGNLVFETTDMTIGWNGTYKGKMVNEGVFVYYVEAQCETGNMIFRKGNITVLH